MDTIQFWDLIKLVIVAAVAFILAKSDRDNRDFQKQNAELFRDLYDRVRKVELKCATTHGRVGRREGDTDDSL
jgi:hypothetical protein